MLLAASAFSSREALAIACPNRRKCAFSVIQAAGVVPELELAVPYAGELCALGLGAAPEASEALGRHAFCWVDSPIPAARLPLLG